MCGRCTPKRRTAPLYVTALLLLLSVTWAFMAGAYPVYRAALEDPNSSRSSEGSRPPDLSPRPSSLSEWLFISATGSWEPLSNQYLMQWGALSAADVLAGQPYRCAHTSSYNSVSCAQFTSLREFCLLTFATAQGTCWHLRRPLTCPCWDIVEGSQSGASTRTV